MKKIMNNPLILVGAIFAFIGLIFLISAIGVAFNMDALKNSPNTKGDVTIIPWIFGILGGTFTAIGIPLTIFSIKKLIKTNKVIENGYYVEAKITNVVLNRSVSINGRHPYFLELSYKDPYTGMIHLFTSDNLLHVTDDLIGCELRVFVDSDNFDNYHVETEIIEEMIQIH